MILAIVVLMVVAMFVLYKILCGATGVSLIMTIVMAITGFLFAAVAGFLVSIIGSSSNPISRADPVHPAAGGGPAGAAGHGRRLPEATARP